MKIFKPTLGTFRTVLFYNVFVLTGFSHFQLLHIPKATMLVKPGQFWKALAFLFWNISLFALFLLLLPRAFLLFS
jgi:hypothetical protein